MAELQLVHAKDIERLLSKLIDASDEIHVAVAWGSMTDVTKRLLRNKAKVVSFLVGVDFSQTDPDLVDALVGFRKGYVATRFSEGTFHPKIYAFRSKGGASAIVGSANLTMGGLFRNLEGATFITGDPEEPIFKQVFKATASWARKFGSPVTKEYAVRYRASCKRAASYRRPPRNPMNGLSHLTPKVLESELLTMSWRDYARAVYGSRHHDVRKSLDLLKIAQRWYGSKDTFADLRVEERKALAGIIGTYQKTDPELDRDWGWFGSMKGMGDFANRVDRNDPYLARAVDLIPLKGSVTREHFDEFTVLFRKAFRNSTRVGSVPTASRLLAMRRPDTFLCVSRPNLDEASRGLGFAKSTLSLDNYWDRVIEPIRLSPWYNSAKPAQRDGTLWECRVAMLDAILYRP